MADTPERAGETLSDEQVIEIRNGYLTARGYGEAAIIVALCDTVIALRAELKECYELYEANHG